MLDNILFEEELILDIDVVNVGSSEGILYEFLFQGVEGSVGGSNDYILYDVLFQTLEQAGGGVCGSISDMTIITIPHRYLQRINNLAEYI